MGSPLVAVAWDACLLQPVRSRDADAYLRREIGSVPPWSGYFSACPWTAKAIARMMPDSGLLLALDFQTMELIGLAVSQENSCRYCYAALRALLRVLGMSEEQLQRLEQRLAASDLKPRQAAAIRYARRMSRANPPVTPADQAELREVGFTPEEIREVAFVAASVGFINRMSTIPALPPQRWERLPDRWLTRLFRPIVARLVQRTRKRGQARTSVSTSHGDTFRPVLHAFAGSPIEPMLADLLNDLWRSPLLTRRSKALIFAVIGRALGCEMSTAEACAILRREAMSEADVAHVLAHLDGSDLTNLDQALLSFARETVRYEPIQVQRRARQLQHQLTPAQFQEAIGVYAMANAVCRLCAALVAHT